MTIEMEIIPTSGDAFSWGLLKKQLLESRMPDGARRLLGSDPKLFNTITNQFVGPEEPFEPTHFYGIDLDARRALELDIQSNADCWTNEREFLEDFGHNIDSGTKAAIAKQWKQVGYSYCVSSHPRRHPDERSVIVAMAAAIAELCKGFVVVKEAGAFDVPVGVYFPEQLRPAHPSVSDADESDDKQA